MSADELEVDLTAWTILAAEARQSDLARPLLRAVQEIERLAEAEKELRVYRVITETPLDPSEKNKLEAKIRDRDTLLKNENELYRQATARADAAGARERRLVDIIQRMIEEHPSSTDADIAERELRAVRGGE